MPPLDARRFTGAAMLAAAALTSFATIFGAVLLPGWAASRFGGGAVLVGASHWGFGLGVVVGGTWIAPAAERRGVVWLLRLGGASGAVGFAAVPWAWHWSVLGLCYAVFGVGFAAAISGSQIAYHHACSTTPTRAQGRWGAAAWAGNLTAPPVAAVCLASFGAVAAWLAAAACVGCVLVLAPLAPPTPAAPGVPLRAQRPGCAGLLTVWRRGYRWRFYAGDLPAYAAVLAFLPLAGAGRAAWLLPVYGACVAASRYASPLVTERIGLRGSCVMVSLLSATGLALLAHSGIHTAAAGVALAGAATGALTPVLVARILADTPDNERAAMFGAFTSLAEGGYGVSALAVGGAISVLGFGGGYLTVAAGCLVGASAAWLGGRGVSPRSQPERGRRLVPPRRRMVEAARRGGRRFLGCDALGFEPGRACL